MTEPSQELVKFVRKRSWRGLDCEKILKLREKEFPDLDNYLYTEIVLDWISVKRPKQHVVTDFWEYSAHLHLNMTYQDCVRKHLLSLKYSVSYICRTREDAEYPTFQAFSLSPAQLADLVELRPVTVSSPCSVPGCGWAESHHSVKVRLKQTEQLCKLVVGEPGGAGVGGHAHQGYKHWFITRGGASKAGEFLSLQTGSVESLVEQLKKSRVCRICVLIMNYDIFD